MIRISGCLEDHPLLKDIPQGGSIRQAQIAQQSERLRLPGVEGFAKQDGPPPIGIAKHIKRMQLLRPDHRAAGSGKERFDHPGRFKLRPVSDGIAPKRVLPDFEFGIRPLHSSKLIERHAEHEVSSVLRGQRDNQITKSNFRMDQFARAAKPLDRMKAITTLNIDRMGRRQALILFKGIDFRANARKFPRMTRHFPDILSEFFGNPASYFRFVLPASHTRVRKSYERNSG